MSQEEVLSALEKFKRPLSRTEIASVINRDKRIVTHAIGKLIKSNEIKIIEINREQAMEKYNCRRRMRLYYV